MIAKHNKTIVAGIPGILVLVALTQVLLCGQGHACAFQAPSPTSTPACLCIDPDTTPVQPPVPTPSICYEVAVVAFDTRTPTPTNTVPSGSTNTPTGSSTATSTPTPLDCYITPTPCGICSECENHYNGQEMRDCCRLLEYFVEGEAVTLCLQPDLDEEKCECVCNINRQPEYVSIGNGCASQDANGNYCSMESYQAQLISFSGTGYELENSICEYLGYEFPDNCYEDRGCGCLYHVIAFTAVRCANPQLN